MIHPSLPSIFIDDIIAFLLCDHIIFIEDPYGSIEVGL